MTVQILCKSYFSDQTYPKCKQPLLAAILVLKFFPAQNKIQSLLGLHYIGYLENLILFYSRYYNEFLSLSFQSAPCKFGSSTRKSRCQLARCTTSVVRAWVPGPLPLSPGGWVANRFGPLTLFFYFLFCE